MIEIEFSKEEDGKMDEYEIKMCAETLMKAEDIRSDPEKMKAVKEYLKKKKGKIDEIMSIKELREKAQEKAMED
jgi:hypothetical protein